MSEKGNEKVTPNLMKISKPKNVNHFYDFQ